MTPSFTMAKILLVEVNFFLDFREAPLYVMMSDCWSDFKTSTAIAEKDDGPHGTSTQYTITKPRFLNFQKFLKTDQPNDKVTDEDDYPSSKNLKNKRKMRFRDSGARRLFLQ